MPPVRTDHHLSDTETIMWSLESDPALRSAFVSVTFLDRAPDFERFRRRVAEAVATIPALNHRVVRAPVELLAPRWELDAAFDLDFHVRRVAVPAPGTRRQVLDLAALACQDPLDTSRPLWQFTVVEGLEDGEAALVAKMHHVLSDGVGAVRMSSAFLDLSPDGDEPAAQPRPAPPAAGSPAGGNVTAARSALSGLLDMARSPQRLPRQGLDAVGMAVALVRQVTDVAPARSPLWAGRHTLAHRFEILSVDLDTVKRTAAKLGGTVNDVYVAAVTGAAGAYHRARDADVDELRMSMPISTRHDREVGGNAWAPTRVLVPVGETDPLARFALVHERLELVKRDPTLGLTAALVGLGRNIPKPLLVRLARQQVGTVDFACSNVRGAPFDLWVAGARVVSNHPMGPTAGTTFNATVLSYKGRLDLGLNVDAGVVADPGELCGLIGDGFDELAAAAGI